MTSRYLATDPQKAYLRRLLDQAFARRIKSVFDRHHLNRVTKAEASTEIGRLKTELEKLAR